MRKTSVFQLVALFLGLVGVGLYRYGPLSWPSTNSPPVSGRTETEAIIKEENRKVYPYSVVPGGAKTLLEAKRAMRDPAVKEHYAGFDLQKLKQETLVADLNGYVSYRVGDRIFWTTKLLRIRAGESVFTDGINIARARCLNRYSKVPMFPTRPREPAAIVFETPVELPLFSVAFQKIPLPEAPQLPPPMEEFTPTVPTLPQPAQTTSGRGWGWIPIVPFIPPIHRHPTHPPTPPITPPPIPPPAVIPEPEYKWALAGMLLLVILRARRGIRR